MAIENDLRRRAAAFINHRFDTAFEYWDGKLYNRAGDWDAYYEVRLPKDLEDAIADDERSSLVPPDIHFLTNDFRASLHIPFKRAGTVAKLRAVGPHDVANEPKAQKLLDWNLRTTKYFGELAKDAHSLAMRGFAIGLMEEKPLTVFKVVNGRVEDESIFGDAEFPHYRHLDYRKVYFDPHASKLQYPHCRFVCVQEYMTRDALVSLQAKNPDVWDFDADDLKKYAGDPTKDEEKGRDLAKFKRRAAESGGTAPVPVTHYYGEFEERDGSGMALQVIMSVAGSGSGSTMLRFQKPTMPFTPVDMFQVMTLNPMTNRPLSMGKVEAIEDSYLELYKKRNQIVDATEYRLWGINFTGRNTSIPEAHRLGPATFIEVDDPVSVKTVVPGEVNSTFAEAAGLQGELRTMYGSDYALGVNPGQRESATGANILIEGQTRRTVDAVGNMWDSGLERHMQMRFALLQLRMPKELQIRLSEDSRDAFLQVTKQQVQGQFDFAMSLGVDDFTPHALREARFERVFALYREDPDIDQIKLKQTHLQIQGLADASLLLVRPEEREIAANKENALILQYGIQIPVDDAEDDLIHYRVHMMAIVSATQMAEQNDVLAKHVQVLLTHAEMHLSRVQAEEGLQPAEQTILGRGTGGITQPRADLGAGNGSGDRIQATRSSAQKIANDRGPFQ